MSSESPSPPAAPQRSPQADGATGNPLQVFSNVVSAAAGVIGLLYIVGVVVIAGRLWLNRLPGESVLSQLPQPYLLAVGLSEVVLPTLLFPIVYLLLAGIAHGPKLFSAKDDVDTSARRNLKLIGTRRPPRQLTWIGWSGALAFCLLFITYFISVQLHLAVNPDVGLIIAVLVLTIVVVWALGAAFYSDSYEGLPKSKRLGATLGTVAAVALVSLIVWGGNAIATPLDYVKVCAKTISQTGVLIASTSDTVYIGQYPAPAPSPGNLGAFSKSDVTATVNGTDRTKVYEFVCPRTSSST